MASLQFGHSNATPIHSPAANSVDPTNFTLPNLKILGVSTMIFSPTLQGGVVGSAVGNDNNELLMTVLS